MILTTLLLACGDEKTDTAEPSGEPSGEPSSEASSEPSEEPSEEPSGEPSGEPSEEPRGEPSEEPVVDSAFPELMTEYMELKQNAMPLPLGEEGMQDNITVLGMFGYSLSSAFEVILGSAFLPEGETLDCPIVDGTFPQDGFPAEDITVTGGCTNSEGVEFQGSFVYGPTGIVYDDYYTKRPSENCPEVFQESTFRGGSYIDADGNVEVLTTSVNVNVEDDCSTESSTVWMHSNHTTQSTSETAEVTNGTGSIVLSSTYGSFSADVQTVDEVLDDSVCETEPISGTNTMSNGTDTLEFTFDGETDCDEEPTQMLSINGGEAVEVEGSECSNVGQRQGLMLFLLSLIPVWIRKRS